MIYYKSMENINGHNSRKTIGLIINQPHHRYQSMIFPGVLDGTLKQDSSLICFVGKPLRSTSILENRENTAYRLACKKNIDGILILSGSIGNEMTIDELRKFCLEYASLPTVCIATPISGIPSLGLENESGMRELVTHFIKDHGYRRIAFVRGPVKNPEAQLRFRVFREVLAKFGIPFDENLVYNGNFIWWSGTDAIRTFIDERKVRFDALLTANDEMLIGAHRELLSRGIRIPQDVAVGGFDNIDEMKILNPPVTTVAQPLYYEGVKGAEMVCDMLKGKPVPPFTPFFARMVVRRSCGCIPEEDYFSFGTKSEPVTVYIHKKAVDALRDVQDVVFASIMKDSELEAESPKELSKEQYFIEFVLVKYFQELADPMIPSFSKFIYDLIIDSMQQRVSLHFLRLLTGKLWIHTKRALPADSPYLSILEKVHSQANSLILDSMARHYQNSLMKARDFNWTMISVTKTLSKTTDLSELRDVLLQLLPQLGLPSFFIALYLPGEADKNPKSARVKVFLDFRTGIEKPIEVGTEFFSAELIPDQPWRQSRRRVFLVYILATESEQLGYLLLEHNGSQDPNLYEALQGHISASIRASILLEQVRFQASEMKVLLKDQQEKSRELAEAQKVQKDNQNRMLIVEKMASLGRMTAGLSHEMNTPLATIRACLMEVEKLRNEYSLSIGDSEVSIQDHKDIAVDIKKSLEIAQKASERLSGFVKGIKSQTMDLSAKECGTFDAVPVVEEAVLLLKHKFLINNCKIDLDIPVRPVLLFGFGPRLSQVVTNLLNNAIDACRVHPNGHVVLTLVSEPEGTLLTIRDNGVGIPPEIHHKIFDPLFTTKSFAEGTGLGLTIVHDIITGEFRGKIDIDSAMGVGTVFSLQFPDHVEDKDVKKI